MLLRMLRTKMGLIAKPCQIKAYRNLDNEFKRTGRPSISKLQKFFDKIKWKQHNADFSIRYDFSLRILAQMEIESSNQQVMTQNSYCSRTLECNIT